MTRSPIPEQSRRSDEGRRLSDRWANLIVFAVATTLCVLVVSVFDKQIRRRLRTSEYLDYGQYAQEDFSREGGYFPPNVDVLVAGEVAYEPVRLITNSKGFRNAEEFAYAVPDETFRILLMGDSYIAGFRTDQEETIGYRLEEDLNANPLPGFADHQVMIASQHNPAASWYRFQEHGWKYDPTLVVVGVTIGNDITPRDYENTLWPASTETEDGIPRLAQSERPALQSTWQELLLPPDAYRAESRFDFLLEIELNAREFLVRRFLTFGHVTPPEIGNPRPNERFHVHAGGNLTSLGVFYVPPLPEVDDWFRALGEILLGMKQRVVASGSEFLVVLFPTRSQVDERDWRNLTRFYGLDASKFDLDHPSRRILEFCRDGQISCLDLTPGFRESVREGGDRLYMRRGDMHFNTSGQALAAELIGEYIRSMRDS